MLSLRDRTKTFLIILFAIYLTLIKIKEKNTLDVF